MRSHNLLCILIRQLMCIGILILFSFQLAYSQQGNRSSLKPSEAIMGRWALYVKSWLGFGDWKRGETISEFRSDGTLVYYEKTGVTTLVYSVLNQDHQNGTIDLLVQKPSTGGSHVQHIQFSDDRNMYFEQTSLTRKSVRTRRDKTVTMESKHEYLGPPR